MSTTDVDVAMTPLALELKAYFRARLVCLRADPPCAVRPCARHHAEAATALGSVPCEACRTLGIVAHSPGRGSDGFDPCEDCDGYGRTWPTAAAAPFSLDRRRAEGATGVVGPSALPASPGPAAPPPETDNRPGTLTPRAAYRPNDLGQKQV